MLQSVMEKFSNVVVHAVSSDASSNTLRTHDVDGRMVLSMAGRGEFDLVQPGGIVAAATISCTPKDGGEPISISAEAIAQAKKLAGQPFVVQYRNNAVYAGAPVTRVPEAVEKWFQDVTGLFLKEVARAQSEDAKKYVGYRWWRLVNQDGTNASWDPDREELVPVMGGGKAGMEQVILFDGKPQAPAAAASAPAVPEDALMQVVRLVGQLEPKQRENLLAYLILTK